MGERWKPAVILAAAGLVAAACSAAPPDLSADLAASTTSTVEPTPDQPEPTTTSAPDPEPEPTPRTPPAGDVDCEGVAEPAAPPGPGTQTIVLSEDPLVEAAVYPRPEYAGDPWSQWGQGVVLPDGRFVSAIGDHLGADGNSYLYQYDPATGELAMVGDVLSLTDHVAGEWGYGKIHGQLVPVGCEEVVFSTYWGSRRGLEYTESYTGDFLAVWNTTEHSFEVLDVPVPAHGVPSLAGSDEWGLIYGEAVDPFQEGNQGVFFAYDLEAREVVTLDDSPHVGFRSILVDPWGAAMFAAGDSSLTVYGPGSDEYSPHPATLPGDWLRAATVAAPDGTVYGATRDPDALFAMAPDGSIRSLGETRGYVASLALSADAQTLYYVPGAHGDAWEQGTPVIAVDVDSGDEEVLAELNELSEERLGLRLGGTYNVAVDPDGSRLYIGFNSGAAGEESFGEVTLVVVHLEADGLDSAAGEGELELREATAEFGLVDPLTGMHGHAAAVADVDADGWTDLVVGTFGDRPPENYAFRGADGPAPDQFLRGGPDGFTATEGLGSSLMRTSGAAWADLDDDGDLDLVLARNVRNDVDQTVLYENDDGRLREAVVLDDTRGARSIGVLDHDGDGRLDLLLTEDKWTGGSSVLFGNRGDLAFVDVTEAAGLPDDVHALGIGVADLTGNGWPDLVFGGSNRVFMANGDGTYRESASSPLPWEIYGNEDDPAGVAIADMNRDGLLDVVVGQHHDSTVDFDEEVAVRLFLNRGPDGAGDVTLEDVTDAAGLVGLPTKAPHVQIADLDNDGWPEIVTSASAAGGREPAVFRHLGTVDGAAGGVPEFAVPAGLGRDQYWVTGGVADFDRDGRLDVFMVEWEPALPSQLWLNETDAGNWVEIAAPIGTVLSVYEPGRAGDPEALIGSRPVIGSTGYGGGTEPIAHFGLGELDSVDLIAVLPGGATATVEDLRANLRQSGPTGGPD